MIGTVFPIIDELDFDISINVSIPTDFLSTKEFETELAKVMNKMADEAKDFWSSEAGARLTTSMLAYKSGLDVSYLDDESFTLSLTGALAVSVEEGTEPYNMNIPFGKIVPLNVRRELIMVNPIFRTGNGKAWKHPGLPGVNLKKTVIDHIETELIPKYIQQVVEKM